MLFTALSMPCYLLHCVCHVVALCFACLALHVCMLKLHCMFACLICFALLVFGLGVSRNTRNDGRFILEVMKCASILSHRPSWSCMIEVKALCVYVCIHFILNCAIWLLGHHASRCVIGGPRVENHSPLSSWNDREGSCAHISCKYIAMPFLALCCSKVEKCSKTGRPARTSSWPTTFSGLL